MCPLILVLMDSPPCRGSAIVIDPRTRIAPESYFVLIYLTGSASPLGWNHVRLSGRSRLSRAGAFCPCGQPSLVLITATMRLISLYRSSGQVHRAIHRLAD